MTISEIRNELRASCPVSCSCYNCSDNGSKFLYEFVGAETLNTATEDELLEHIMAIAVKSTHKEVHRIADEFWLNDSV